MQKWVEYPFLVVSDNGNTMAKWAFTLNETQPDIST